MRSASCSPGACSSWCPPACAGRRSGNGAAPASRRRGCAPERSAARSRAELAAGPRSQRADLHERARDRVDLGDAVGGAERAARLSPRVAVAIERCRGAERRTAARGTLDPRRSEIVQGAPRRTQAGADLDSGGAHSDHAGPEPARRPAVITQPRRRARCRAPGHGESADEAAGSETRPPTERSSGRAVVVHRGIVPQERSRLAPPAGPCGASAHAAGRGVGYAVPYRSPPPLPAPMTAAEAGRRAGACVRG